MKANIRENPHNPRSNYALSVRNKSTQYLTNDMTLQVFEHQKLRIGERLSQQQWQALVAFLQRQGERYFTVLHNGIQFSHYVGALQVGDLTIEILPKIDETEGANLQPVLLDVLRECRILQPESVATASLQARNGSLLEIYIIDFLNEIEKLLQQGLTQTYISNSQNRKIFKGKLLMHKQLQHNLLHHERFFTETFEFSYAHPFNRILYTALLSLHEIALRPIVATKLQSVLAPFPPLEFWNAPLPDFDTLRFDRHTLRYKNALQTAFLILQQTQPDVRAGRLPVLSILFDMNFLFEAYIFRQLQKAATERESVKRQVPKSFWNRRSIQPDILLTIDNQPIVIDTKWKKLQKVSPTMEDLRQIFVYNQYFEATHSVLVYPRVRGLKDLSAVPFQPIAGSGTTYFCEVRFVELVREGRLNKGLGRELLERLNS